MTSRILFRAVLLALLPVFIGGAARAESYVFKVPVALHNLDRTIKTMTVRCSLQGRGGIVTTTVAQSFHTFQIPSSGNFGSTLSIRVESKYNSKYRKKWEDWESRHYRCDLMIPSLGSTSSNGYVQKCSKQGPDFHNMCRLKPGAPFNPVVVGQLD